jgi:hypothetical protein
MSMASSPLAVGFPGPVGSKGTGIYEDVRLTNELGEYEVQRLRRIKKNEAYLDKLGLGKGRVVDMVNATKKLKKTTALRRRVSVVKPGQERRSNRVRGRADNLVQLSYDDSLGIDRATRVYDSEDEDDAEEFREERIKLQGARTRVRLSEDYEMSLSEKQLLEKQMDENYLTKFEQFLRYYDKVSDANCRSVLRQVDKLSSGEGITYSGWPEGTYFKAGVKITPLSDLITLREEATEMELRCGRDTGNGWLLKHPIKKLLMFQQFALNNPEFLGSKKTRKDYVEED